MQTRYDPKQFRAPGEAASRVIRARAEHLAEVIDDLPVGRARSLALTNLEQAVMWANKAIAQEIEG